MLCKTLIRNVEKEEVDLRLRENLLDLLLLIGMLLSVMGSFIPVRWTWGLEVLIWTAMGGLLAGFLLARSVFRPSLAHGFSLIYGIVGTAIAVSQRLPNWLSLRLKAMELVLRMWRWFVTAWQGQGRSSDTLVFVVQLAFLSWWISYIAAWFTFRRRQIKGVLIPSGLLFFWNLYYSPLPLTGYLLAYLFCGLLLVSHLTLRRRQVQWQRAVINSDPAGEGSFLRYGVPFALTIIALAWLIPPLTSPQTGALIQWLPGEKVGVRIQQEWQRLFASLEYPLHGPGEPFGMELRWPGPISRDEEQVLTIQAPFRRYYWRAVVYDEYNGREWVNTDTKLALLESNMALMSPQEYIMRQEVTQTMTTYLPGTTVLFGAAQPLRMSLPAKVRSSSTIEETPVSTGETHTGRPAQSPSMWQSHRPLRLEETYTVVSSLSIASEEDLRGAGTRYPELVRERYLQLPADVPIRVADLAQSITEQTNNVYDHAMALESYLRTIPYNDQVGAPPSDRNSVDYFLFDHREGYCSHYAAALVVMARTLGIPARLAVGYSSGEYHAEEERFTVTQENGHAWVEVFFPEYGWVEFEPTAAQPIIVRPRPVVVESEEGESPPGEEMMGDQVGDLQDLPEDELPYPRPDSSTVTRIIVYWRILVRVIVSMVLLGILTVGGWNVGRWWIGRHFTPASWAYTRLVTFGRWLKCPLSESQTPHQYAHELSDLVPQARTLINHLVEMYVVERFGQRPATKEEAGKAWRDLRPELIRSWLRQWWATSSIRLLLGTLRRVFR